jgi:hypothetical protein
MESETIAALVEDSSSDFKEIEESAKALHAERLDAAKRQLKNSNSKERGLIIWLNPGISRDIKPEPVHLRHTINFLKNNVSYEAGKCDVYDMYDLNVDTQYNMIMQQLQQSNVEIEHPVKKKNSVMESVLNSMDDKLVADAPKKPSKALEKKMKKHTANELESRMKEITATASNIFTDIMNNRITATDSEGRTLHCNVV